MFRPMKPETIVRRAKQAKIDRIARHDNLVSRLEEQVRESGSKNSIWFEMLQEIRSA